MQRLVCTTKLIEIHKEAPQYLVSYSRPKDSQVVKFLIGNFRPVQILELA
jgi:hypothetical protein